MNALSKLNLIKKIASTLQNEMTTSEINIFLNAHGISDANSYNVQSKRVYVQGILAPINADRILQIATELKIDLSVYDINLKDHSIPEDIWLPNKTKVFISHLARDKENASKIQYYLLKKEFSGFVAHEDIEPSKDWLKVILSALHSMDFLVALITTDFFTSPWTNQEIGYALGNKKPVISVKIEEDPKGFIAISQAIEGKNRHPKDIVDNIIHVYNQLLEK